MQIVADKILKLILFFRENMHDIRQFTWNVILFSLKNKISFSMSSSRQFSYPLSLSLMGELVQILIILWVCVRVGGGGGGGGKVG